ncbi:SGNH/GDSL hydrolase family protein [Proteus faecis]|uniref:tail fiber/spike domain-containing protein n=1 Tax=Proteus faecis TaxID=2050967 RepID=UPI003075CA9A
MSTIPTQNPVPSESPRDLKYNSSKFDEFVTSNNHFYTDRFGKKHYTIDGINYLSKQAMLNYGYITKRSFESGNTIINPNDVLLWESNGEYYRWDGELPKVVSAGSTPESAGGIDNGKWKSVGDATLRERVDNIDALNIPSHITGGDVYTDFSMQQYQMPALNVISGNCSVMLIGDSITTGVGANNNTEKYTYNFFRSLFNMVDHGFGNDIGFGYETYIEMEQAIRTAGVTTTGSITRDGVVMSRLLLLNNEHVQITGRELAVIGCVYDGGSTTGNIEISVNGSIIKTITTNKTSGLKDSGLVVLMDGFLCSESDVIKIKAIDGSVKITAINTFKTDIYNDNHIVSSPIAYVVSKSGWAYQDFISPEKVDEISFYANLYRGSTNKLFILNLGTNNIYNPSASKTPDEYISLLNTLILEIRKKVSRANFAIAVPLRADESKWNSEKGEYFTYVNKILSYCKNNNHLAIRLDRTIMSLSGKFYTDGVHPDQSGHKFLAMKLCESLFIPFNPYENKGGNDPRYNKLISEMNKQNKQKIINLTNDRINNTTYQNDTDLPITIYFTSKSATGTNGITVYVDNNVVSRIGVNTGSNSGNHSISFQVPSGSSYKIESTSGIEIWSEFR